MPVDPYAVQGFGTGADEYDRHRPDWPPEAVDGALERFGLSRKAVLMDLAAGTGKLTRLLLTRAEHVIAVEPLDDMRRRLEETVTGAEIVVGVADDMPVEDGAVDAVFVAEAFHWFATPSAAGEIARVIRPGGALALMWNIHAFNADPWTAAVGKAIAEFIPRDKLANDRNKPEEWGPAFEGSPFEPFSKYEVPNEQRTDIDGFVGHVMTWSFTRALPAETQQALAERLHAALGAEHPSPGEIVIPFRTQVYWARRL